MDKNLGLGKGLSALMGEDLFPVPVNQPIENKVNTITLINIDTLVPSPYQPRRVFSEEALADLVHSIQEKGVLQPLLVRVRPNHIGQYEIIAGERRFRASKQAGLTQVPVIIKDFDDKAALEVALIENLQREDLNPLEEGEAYKRLLEEFQYTQEELSKVVGKSRSHVANMMRLLDLPDDIKKMVENREITIGHARALLTAQNATEIASAIVKKGLSVRQVEKMVNNRKVKVPKPPKLTEKDMEKDSAILVFEREMSNLLKTPVSINWDGIGGSIVISYDNLDTLDIILQQLTALGPITE